MAEPPGRGRLECCACGRVLERQVGRSLDGALACSMATLLLLVPAYLMPVMTVRFAGLNISTHLVAGGVQLGTKAGSCSVLSWPCSP